MEYRREIDGLRALAVLPVILFHADFQAFSGGFVGVDVFFVISGYLITTLIIAELEQKKFSIVNFYERRARRILPALFLVMLCCIPLAWLWLPAAQMKDFAHSLIAVSVFASNVLFLRESGYFDTAAELKPLLHTWSLAVEEQYYIFFPLLLMLFWRLGKRRLVILLSIAGLASLALAQWASFAKPSAAFFLLPTRGWELLIGSLAAFYLSSGRRNSFDKTVVEVGGWLGILLILFAVVFYDKATPFPGLYALAPTVGALLIILFATEQTLAGRFMGNRIFVGLGLLSYSAYLWHQPLFAFARHAVVGQPSNFLFIALAALSLLLAYLTWRYVETPFRVKAWVPRKSVFAFSLVAMVFFTALGFVGHLEEGFPKISAAKRIPTEKRDIENFIVLGDSHGGHLLSGLGSITSGTVINDTSDGCIPFRNVDRYDYRFVPGACAKKINGYLDDIIAKDPKATIILSSMGPVYLDGTPFNGKDYSRVVGLVVQLISDKSIKDRAAVFEIGMRSTLAELSRLKNSSIVFAVDVPELGIDQGCAQQSKEIDFGAFKLRDEVTDLKPEDCFVSRKNYDARAQNYKAFVKKIASEFPKVRIFDPTEAFCDESKCSGFDPRYGLLYQDFDHLSTAGSWLYASKLIDFLHAQ